MPRAYQLVIGQAEAGLRLDHYLVRRLPDMMSRGMIQRGIEAGTVQLNARTAKAHAKLKVGDVITAVFSELGARSGSVELTAQDIPVKIIYEDESLLVVDKPAGLVTHPAPGHWDGTLVNALVWHFKHQTRDLRPQTQDTRLKSSVSSLESRVSSLRSQVSGLESALPRAGIVHRLDKDTSGLLLVAKTESAHIALSRQLKARTIHRRYLALVEGHVPLDRGTIAVPIGRHTTHRKVMAVRHLGGRTAVTHYQVVSRLEGEGAAVKNNPSSTLRRFSFPTTLLNVSLDTGRTHQIRVHMAHIGHPVVADLTYGNHPESYWKATNLNRHFLHAFGLAFEHPVTKKPVELWAPLPEELAAWLPSESVDRLKSKHAPR